jgi:hypothetical protein
LVWGRRKGGIPFKGNAQPKTFNSLSLSLSLFGTQTAPTQPHTHTQQQQAASPFLSFFLLECTTPLLGTLPATNNNWQFFWPKSLFI